MQVSESERQAWMGLLARAPEGRAAALFEVLGTKIHATVLRAPEVGSVMIRGRTNASGAPFNLGEMTVTRCALRLEDGTVGHGYVQGRRKVDAEIAARIDALMQTDAAIRIRDEVLAPLKAEESARRTARAEKAAATKVEFFTMARGEDT